MNRRIYTTARGKKIDLGDVVLKNEDVRAVGNMPVNARGDIVDSKNKTVVPRNRAVAKHYQRQTNVVDAPVFATKAEARAAKTTPAAETSEVEDTAALSNQPTEMSNVTDLPMDTAAESVTAEAPAVEESEIEEPKTQGGLAGAIAKSRKVTQTKTTPPGKAKKNMRL